MELRGDQDDTLEVEIGEEEEEVVGHCSSASCPSCPPPCSSCPPVCADPACTACAQAGGRVGEMELISERIIHTLDSSNMSKCNTKFEGNEGGCSLVGSPDALCRRARTAPPGAPRPPAAPPPGPPQPPGPPAQVPNCSMEPPHVHPCRPDPVLLSILSFGLIFHRV